MMLIVGLALTTVALAGTTTYLELQRPSASYVDGYNFAVAFTHGLANRRPQQYSRLDARSSCSVWSFSNAGGVPPGDTPRAWREGCEAALTTRATSTVAR
jgi:hypothetical protein